MKKTERFWGAFLSVCIMLSCAAGLTCTAAAAGTDPCIVVSLGDSYSAGEGIEPYYGQDKTLSQKIKDADWLAHRSQNSWGSMLVVDGVHMTRGKNWFFAAASGAETKDITGSQSISYQKLTSSGRITQGTVQLDPQIKIFDGLALTDNDFVTLSIGGNDIGFMDLMLSALFQATKEGFPNMADTLIANLPEYYRTVAAVPLSDMIKDKKAHFGDAGGVRSKIKAAYKSIAEKSGKASIIVAGYPELFNPDGFNFKISILNVKLFPGIAKEVNDAVKWLNRQLSDIVSECRSEGMNIYFVEPKTFKGHEAYTSDAYINGLTLAATDQDLNDAVMISSGSMHPNSAGAAAYAAAVQKKINEISGSTDTVTATATAEKTETVAGNDAVIANALSLLAEVTKRIGANH